eukprot:6173107-Pleurochrysis_carterae.AAC.2
MCKEWGEAGNRIPKIRCAIEHAKGRNGKPRMAPRHARVQQRPERAHAARGRCAASADARRTRWMIRLAFCSSCQLPGGDHPR